MSSEFNNVPEIDDTPSVRISVAEQVLIANARAHEARRVPLTAALTVASRVLAKSPYEEATVRAFAVERAVDRFLELATKGARQDQLHLEHTDLLSVGHPSSTAETALTASAVNQARAAWIAGDLRIDDTVRPLVAAAYGAKYGSVEHKHAVTRLRALPASMVPVDIALLADGNSSIERSIRAEAQLRDNEGQFAEQGKGGSLKTKIGKLIKSILGIVVGGSDEKGHAEIYITEDDPELGLKKGDILKGNIKNFTAVGVALTEEELKRAGIKMPTGSTSLDADAQPIEELLANKLEAPSDWTKDEDGNFNTGDGFKAIPLGDNKYAVNDDKGNPIAGLEAAEWPEIQAYLVKEARSDKKPAAAAKTAITMVKPGDLKPGDKVNLKGIDYTVVEATPGKLNDVSLRLQREDDKTATTTQVFHKDDSIRITSKADQPEPLTYAERQALPADHPDHIPAQLKGEPTSAPEPEDASLPARRSNVKVKSTFNDPGWTGTFTRNFNTKEERDAFVASIPKGLNAGVAVFNPSNVNKLFPGGKPLRHFQAEVSLRWVEEGKGNKTQQAAAPKILKWIEANGFDPSVGVHESTDRVEPIPVSEIPSIGEPLPPKPEVKKTPVIPTQPVSTKNWKGTRLIPTDYKDKSNPAQGFDVIAYSDGTRVVHQGTAHMNAAYIKPLGDGRFEVAITGTGDHTNGELVDTGSGPRVAAIFDGPNAELDAQMWLSAQLHDAYRPSSSSDQPIINLFNEDFKAYYTEKFDKNDIPQPSEMLDAPSGIDGIKNEPSGTPKSPPSNAQVQMIRSMLLERSMSAEQRQEFMDRLAMANKDDINELFNDIKTGFSWSKTKLNDKTDPLNQHSDPKIAQLKQALAFFDLDGSIRRMIDEQTINGPEGLDTAKVTEAVNSNWYFDRSSKSTTSAEGAAANDVKEALKAADKTEAQKAAELKARVAEYNEKAKKNRADMEKFIFDLLTAKANKSDTATTMDEYQVALDDLEKLLAGKDKNNVMDRIRSGELSDPKDIRDALGLEPSSKPGLNQESDFAKNMKNLTNGTKSLEDAPEMKAILEAIYGLPNKPEGSAKEELKYQLKGYDNENGELAYLIDSGAPGNEITNWLENNSPAWNDRVNDYNTGGSVDFPSKSQLKAWKSTENLINKINAWDGREPGEELNQDFINGVSELLPPNTVIDLNAKLLDDINGGTLIERLGGIRTEQDLQDFSYDVMSYNLTNKNLSPQQQAGLNQVLDAAMQHFYASNPELKDVVDEPANIVIPVEKPTGGPIGQVFDNAEIDKGLYDSIAATVDAAVADGTLPAGDYPTGKDPLNAIMSKWAENPEANKQQALDELRALSDAFIWLESDEGNFHAKFVEKLRSGVEDYIPYDNLGPVEKPAGTKSPYYTVLDDLGMSQQDAIALDKEIDEFLATGNGSLSEYSYDTNVLNNIINVWENDPIANEAQAWNRLETIANEMESDNKPELAAKVRKLAQGIEDYSAKNAPAPVDAPADSKYSLNDEASTDNLSKDIQAELPSGYEAEALFGPGASHGVITLRKDGLELLGMIYPSPQTDPKPNEKFIVEDNSSDPTVKTSYGTLEEAMQALNGIATSDSQNNDDGGPADVNPKELFDRSQYNKADIEAQLGRTLTNAEYTYFMNELDDSAHTAVEDWLNSGGSSKDPQLKDNVEYAVEMAAEERLAELSAKQKPGTASDEPAASESAVANPFSSENSDKALAEAGISRGDVAFADADIETVLDNNPGLYVQPLSNIAGNSNVIKNILDSLDESNGANNISLYSQLVELGDALQSMGVELSIVQQVKKLADVVEEFVPAGGNDNDNGVTIGTIIDEQNRVISITDWMKIGGQKGSNEGGTYKDPKTGEEYYVKTPKSELHAENERLAAALYKALGIPSANVLQGINPNGNPITISPMIEGATPNLKKKMTDKEYLARLQQGFAVDAWLANWDVIGLQYDNVVTDANGEAVRVDPGGALLFRAQGEPKGDSFGETVPELAAFTDPTSNRPAAKVFSSMTPAQKEESAKLLQNITPSQIDELVNSIVTDPAKREELKTKLKARREFILNHFGIDGNSGGEGPTPDAPEAPTGTANVLAKEADRASLANSLQKQLPAGYNVKHEPGTDGLGVITVANPAGYTVLVVGTDPENPGVYTTVNLKGDWKKTEHATITGALTSAVLQVDDMSKPTAPTAVVPEPKAKPKKYPVITGAGPKLSDGSIGKIGAKVVHIKTGEVGIIHQHGKNPSYVEVRFPDGKKKLKSINQLKVVDDNNGGGGSTAPEPTAPEAPTPATPDSLSSPDLVGPEGQTMSDGSPAKIGTQVVHTGTGEVGTIVGYAKSPGYVNVQGADGKKKLKSVKMLKASTPDETFALEQNDNFTSILDKSNGAYTDYVVVKNEDGTWVVKAKDQKVTIDFDTRDEAEKEALSLAAMTKSAIDMVNAKMNPAPAPAAQTGPKKFTYDLLGLPSVEDAQPVTKSNDPLDPANENIKADADGNLMVPGAIFRDKATGKLGVYRMVSFGNPDDIRIYWADGKMDVIKPDTVVATGKHIDVNVMKYYSSLEPLDFEANSEELTAANNQGGSISGANGSVIGYKHLVTDKSGELGVVLDYSPDSAGYVKVAYPNGTKKRKANTLTPTGRRYTSDEGSIVFSQKLYSALEDDDKYGLPKFGNKKTNTSPTVGIGPSDFEAGTGAAIDNAPKLDWDQSDFESIPSLHEALEIVKDTSNNSNAGLQGTSAAIDAGDVEDLDLRIMRAKLDNGEDGFYMKYDLTSWAGDELAAKLVALAQSNDPNLTVLNGLQFSEHIAADGRIEFGPHLKGNNGASRYSNSQGQTFIITMDDGTKVMFMRADRPTISGIKGFDELSDGNYPVAFHNQVFVLTPDSAATPQGIANALQSGGVRDPRPSTQADANVLIENRLISVFGNLATGKNQKSDASKNLTGEARAKLLKKIKATYGITPENASLTSGAAGRVEIRLDEESGKKIAAKTGITYITHLLYSRHKMAYAENGETDEQHRDRVANWFVSRIAGPTGGLTSTAARWTEGLPNHGQSSNADISTGGADYVFTVPMNDSGNIHTQHGSYDRGIKYGTNNSVVPMMYYDPAKLFRRTDIWANSDDKYGRREGKPIPQAKPKGYEVMFKDRVGVEDLKLILVKDQDMRTRIITKMRQAGITDIDGVPLEQIVKVQK